MMLSGCCCCRDFYLWDGESDLVQARTAAGSLVPTLKHTLTSPYYRFAVDNKNKFVFVAFGTSPNHEIYKTPTLELQGLEFVDEIIGDGPLGGAGITGIAVDYENSYLLYISYDDFSNNVYQIRAMAYDGGDDVQQYLESPINVPPHVGVNVTVIDDTLTFYGTSIALYARRYAIAHGPFDIQTVYQLRQTALDSPGVSSTLLTLFDIRGNFINPITITSVRAAPQLGAVLVTWVDSRGSDLIFHLSTFDLTSGARADLLTSTQSAIDPFFSFTSPQHSTKDSRIYFVFEGFNPGGSENAGIASVDTSGLDEQILCDFGDPSVSALATGLGSLFRLGCGLEITGETYDGCG